MAARPKSCHPTAFLYIQHPRARWSFVATTVHGNIAFNYIRGISVCTVVTDNDHRAHYYASLRAPSLITTGITIGSWPYFSANAVLAFAMKLS